MRFLGPEEGNIIGAGGVVVAAFVGAWATLRGRRRSVPAETQDEINKGFVITMNDLKDRVLRLEVENRGLKQYINLLIALLHKNGIDIPPPDVIEEGFLILPPTKKEKGSPNGHS
jgi:hypothetical protein